MRKKIVFLPYDFDSAIGINNEGDLVFDYSLEDTDQTQSGADVYNGQDSVLWNNVRKMFFKELQLMYQNLRSTGALSYAKIEKAFEDHQNKWGEAIFNEDMQFKCIDPLVNDGDGTYLAMMRGSKTEHRKWWLYNRFKYIDSKYNAGDALSDYIQLRGYAKADITVTPYADIYPTIKYGSYLVQTRGKRNRQYTLECPVDTLNDTEIYIYSASQLASVGDLSGLKVGLADFSRATKMQDIKLGDSDPNYDNGNLKTLSLGNNVLLRSLDVRNCSGLGNYDMKAPDISGCTNIENVYFDGTNITGVVLPNGGILKVLHLPATVTNLTIRNQRAITDFTIPSYANITSLWLDNVSSAVDSKAILNAISAGSRVRLINVAWEVVDAAEILALFDTLDTMRGLDEYGNNMETAQVSGTIHTTSLSGPESTAISARLANYPYLNVTADHTSATRTFKTWDGSETVGTVIYVDGVAQSSIPSVPSRSQTNQYTYTGVGWATTQDAQNADMSTTCTMDDTVYAAYSRTIRSHTIVWMNGSTTLRTDTIRYGDAVTWGQAMPTQDGQTETGWTPTVVSPCVGPATYTATYLPTYTATFVLASIDGGSTLYTQTKVPQGTVPTYGGTTPVSTRGEAYVFNGWNPALTGIQANTTYTAVFVDTSSPLVKYLKHTMDEWESDTATAVGQYAFYNMTTLTSVETSATDIGTYAFSGCSNLTMIDLTGSGQVNIGSNAFQNCNKITALIIRSTAGVATASSNALPSVPFNVLDGAIYVPSSLVATYKSTAPWSTYASRIFAIEDYPVTNFDTVTDTWAQIKAASDNGTYDSKYAIHDTKSFDFGNFTAEMELVAKDTDIKHDGTGNAHMTWLCKKIVTTHAMNSTNTTAGGYPASAMKSWLEGDEVLGAFPAELKSALVEVDKTYYDNDDTSTKTTSCKIWIPSSYEVCITNSYLKENSGVKYNSVFSDNSSRVKYNSSGSANAWWLRSAYSGTNFVFVSNGGGGNYGSATYAIGVVFGFCI